MEINTDTNDPTKDIKLKVDPNGATTLTILHGDAPEPLPLQLPKKLEISGTLDGPSDWLLNRISIIPKEKTHVTFNNVKGTIVLMVNEDMDVYQKITGSLQLNPEFTKLGINEDKIYSLRTLREALKFLGRYFTSKDVHRTLLANFTNFTAKIDKEISQSNDFKGNAANSVTTSLKSEIPLDFKLNMPVIMGYPDMSFDVEVCIDATGGDIKIWLESVEIDENIKSKTADIMAEKRKIFTDSGIVIITTA